mmetsp:Transcript_15847/g.34858  ORF Transcript_15847/g.34858 Transcript_15847/m.34858 type:complete len:208 (+) Transcript_15847:817-1440(+)
MTSILALSFAAQLARHLLPPLHHPHPSRLPRQHRNPSPQQPSPHLVLHHPRLLFRPQLNRPRIPLIIQRRIHPLVQVTRPHPARVFVPASSQRPNLHLVAMYAAQTAILDIRRVIRTIGAMPMQTTAAHVVGWSWKFPLSAMDAALGEEIAPLGIQKTTVAASTSNLTVRVTVGELGSSFEHRAQSNQVICWDIKFRHTKKAIKAIN